MEFLIELWEVFVVMPYTFLQNKLEQVCKTRDELIEVREEKKQLSEETKSQNLGTKEPSSGRVKSQTKGGASQEAKKIDRSLRKYRSRLSLEIKMSIIGSGGVGKTSMVARYISGFFLTSYDPTIEDYYRKEVVTTVRVGDSTYGINAVLDMVDTAGQEQFSSVRDKYIKDVDIVLICYSIINRSTFEEVTRLSRLTQSLETPYIIIGLKKDFRNSDSQMVQVSLGEGRELAHQLRAEGYFECSAKTGEGVDEVFNATIQIGVQK